MGWCQNRAVWAARFRFTACYWYSHLPSLPDKAAMRY